MHKLIQNIQINVSDQLYLKNPEHSELGRNIVSGSIALIESIGIEHFTFKKLAMQLQTTESSIYRYFENKHKLLVYLTLWYWFWVEYHIVFATSNLQNREEKLSKALDVIINPIGKDQYADHINLDLLHKIITSESIKVYLTKEVNREDKEGYFSGYKRLVNRLSELMLEINPHYRYAHSLATTVLEGTLLQKYFSDHIPAISDFTHHPESMNVFFKELVFSTLNSKA